MPDIPYDIYESPAEVVIHLPLGGVDKESLSIIIQDGSLIVSALRKQPQVKESLSPKHQSCYRGSFEKSFPLPNTSFFNGITSTLTPENILIITIPKVLMPESVPVTIQQ